jgi:predicted AAA+ superfamily ATPase
LRARDNPFAAQRILTIRYRLAGITWEEMLERLAALRFRAAIVGPHGHGKTTLLEDLGERLDGQGFRVRTATLRAGERRLGPGRAAALFRDPGPADLLLVDGAEQLDRLAW